MTAAAPSPYYHAQIIDGYTLYSGKDMKPLAEPLYFSRESLSEFAQMRGVFYIQISVEVTSSDPLRPLCTRVYSRIIRIDDDDKLTLHPSGHFRDRGLDSFKHVESTSQWFGYLGVETATGAASFRNLFHRILITDKVEYNPKHSYQIQFPIKVYPFVKGEPEAVEI